MGEAYERFTVILALKPNWSEEKIILMIVEMLRHTTNRMSWKVEKAHTQ